MGGVNMYISSVETYLPGTNITNKELGELINFKPQLIEKLFGNYGRHFSTDILTGKINNNTSDLISIVLRKLIEKNKNSHHDIDFIITSTATPDHLLPTSINEACYKLGIKNIETYQIIGGCSGAVQALNLAKYILKSGLHKKGILVGVECSNKFLNLLDSGNQKTDTREIVNYVLFGDGVGGCILSSEETRNSLTINEVSYKYIGLDEKIGQLANWKGTRENMNHSPMLQEEYKLIEKIVPELTQDSFKSFLSENNLKISDKMWLMPPQLSGKMVDVICKKIEFPETHILSRVADIGNCANAALFFQLKEFFDVANDGEDGIAISIESSRWLTSRVHVKKGGKCAK